MTLYYWTNDLDIKPLDTPEHRVLTPRVGVAVIVLNKGKLLAMKRHHNSLSGAGDWSIPGGKLDFGETMRDCALRELQEETGIQAYWSRFFDYSENFFPTDIDQTPMHWITMYFVVPLPPNSEPKIMEPDKCEELLWMTPDEFVSQEKLFLPNKGLLSKDPKAYHKAVDTLEELKRSFE